MFKDFPRNIHHQWLGMISIAAITIGMLYSEALMSSGMIALAGNAVLNKQAGSIFKKLFHHKALLALTGIFFLYLISGLWSEDLDFFIRRLRMTLPFLFMPLGILSIPRFDRSIWYPFLSFFIALISIISLYSLAMYIVDFKQFNEAYKQGHVLYTPTMHIRYSLMVVFAISACLYLIWKKYILVFQWERYLQVGLALFLVIYLHILAVRSGLLAFYAVLLYGIIYLFFRSKKYKLGALILVVMIALGSIAYLTVPTFKNKIGYTKYSIELLIKGEAPHQTSDSHRLGSLQAGIALAKSNPVIGVGIGDIRNACEAYYAEHLPELHGESLLPHNQYLFVFVATGIFGLLYFIWATFLPLIYHRNYRDLLFTAFHVIVFSSFMVEHTIETQLGIAYYLLFLLAGMRYADESLRMIRSDGSNAD